MNWTILSAAAAIRAGKLTCVSLLEQCLERIARHDGKVRAWVLVDGARARAEAEACDRELKQGYDRGLLHGIPIGIKDIIDVFDWPTACGSSLWRDAVARKDAAVVLQLREAGAVLVGKTVTTQYASFDPPPTRNPWNLARTPGGSSSGSAAAVAARMCLAALCSQTGGSITRPASYCGVPACKPTYGAVSLDGILPLASSMDHPGAMASCVHDVALVMQAIANPGASDWVTPLGQELRPPVLGRPREMFDRLADDAVCDMMEEICRKWVVRGATIRDVALPAGFAEVTARHRIIMAVESASFHQERLRRHPEDYGPNIRALVEEGLACPGFDYFRTKEHQARLVADMAAVFRDVDALICPATTTPAPDAATTGDPAFNSPWSYTRLPVVSIPVALSPDGLPLGVQLIGAAGGEGGLFQAAAWGEATIGEPSLL